METTKEERERWMQTGGPLGPPEQHYRLIRDADLAGDLLEVVAQFVEDTDYESEDSIVDVHDPVGGRVSRDTLHKARQLIAKAHGEAQDG